MAAAVIKKHESKNLSWLQRVARSRAFKLTSLAVNIVVPLAVLALMYAGARSVHESREQTAQARLERDSAIAETNEAISSRKKAEALRLKIEKEIAQLRTEKARVEAEKAKVEADNKKLLAEADPDTVIARVRRELGGETPRIVSDSLYKQGRDASAAGNLKLAYALYLAARDDDSTYVWPHVGLGNVAVARGDFNVAEKHFARAVQADPNESDATYNLASVSARLKKWDRAEEYAEKTLTIEPGYSRVQTLLKEIREGRRLQKLR